MTMENLATIIAHYENENGRNATLDLIATEMLWWGQVYDVFDAGYPVTAREKVLQLATAAMSHGPQHVATCDCMSATLEELVDCLTLALSMPTQTVSVITLPGDLTRGGGDD